MKLGLVIPWFGKSLKGGAEQYSWHLVAALRARGHDVTVLTTTSASFQSSWDIDAMPAGLASEDGVSVHRFALDARNGAAFEDANARLVALNSQPKLAGVRPVSVEDERAFVEQNIRSRRLVSYLRDSAAIYDAYIFIPYLYGVVLDGVHAVADKAILHPCLHDETYAYLPRVASAFHRARRIMYNSLGERQLAERLYGPGIVRKGHVVGGGIEIDPGTHDESLLPSVLQGRRYVLYAGRKDATKNVPLLVQAFKRAALPEDVRLVLIGPGTSTPSDRVIDLGLVDDATKLALLAGAHALAQPSVNESFSRVVFESWALAKPVLVHGGCAATSLPVAESGGGWVVQSDEAWSATLVDVFSADGAVLRERGEAGRRYGEAHSSWASTAERYERIVHEMLGAGAPRIVAPQSEREIIHVTPHLVPGDAVSNVTRFLHYACLGLGLRSRIVAEWVHPHLREEASERSVAPLPDGAAILYHHSTGADIFEEIACLRGPKAMLYHNITPEAFFAKWAPQHIGHVRRGREQLTRARQAFDAFWAVSSYNASELEAVGAEASLLPIAVDAARFDVLAHPELMRLLNDGKKNLLCVGRFAPNKCQHDLLELIRTAADLGHSDWRLVLVGKAPLADGYVQFCMRRVAELQLDDALLIVNDASESEIAAAYRGSHLYVSASEHEGFAVPLVEAMHHGLPAVAYAAGAVAETLGGTGALFTRKHWPSVVAQIAAIFDDRSLATSAVAQHPARLRAFAPETVLQRFAALLFDWLDLVRGVG